MFIPVTSTAYITVVHSYITVCSDHLAEQLWVASWKGQDIDVLRLLQRGAPPQSDYYQRERGGQSPLWVACSRNHPPSADYLLKWGASVTITTPRGSTPLHASYGSMDCVRLLLDHHSPTGKPNCHVTTIVV